jgi:hypothetical protein
MNKENIICFALLSLLFALPLYVASLAGGETRIGVLSYIMTNTNHMSF